MENFERIIDILQSYLNKIKNNTITVSEGLLLMELVAKTDLLKSKEPFDEKDWLSYSFIGYYIYSQLYSNKDVPPD